jgi:hypothetical protein
MIAVCVAAKLITFRRIDAGKTDALAMDFYRIGIDNGCLPHDWPHDGRRRRRGSRQQADRGCCTGSRRRGRAHACDRASAFSNHFSRTVRCWRRAANAA